MTRNNYSATITEEKIQNQCTNVTYPQVGGLKNSAVEAQINELIKRTVFNLIPPEGCEEYQEIFGTYEVKLNEKGILSININMYTFRIMAANGLDVQKSINVDLETGKVYQLYELFKPGSDYRIVLSRMIEKQIEERQLPMIREFTGITDYQDYYLTDDSLVIYFQEITYFPHYAGIQEFPIPYRQIRNLVRPGSPIARLLQDP
ncbi:MAG: DUF3298 domain-containing protein [Bacillota bacterium]